MFLLRRKSGCFSFRLIRCDQSLQLGWVFVSKSVAEDDGTPFSVCISLILAFGALSVQGLLQPYDSVMS